MQLGSNHTLNSSLINSRSRHLHKLVESRNNKKLELSQEVTSLVHPQSIAWIVQLTTWTNAFSVGTCQNTTLNHCFAIEIVYIARTLCHSPPSSHCLHPWLLQKLQATRTASLRKTRARACALRFYLLFTIRCAHLVQVSRLAMILAIASVHWKYVSGFWWVIPTVLVIA